MIETIIQVENQVYPFEENTPAGHLIKVHDVQAFASPKDLS